ncbi:MAG TPA: helicase HerA-like domain-containing protein [Solirubrobacteraceae bacterium]|nr:helicase HerA-like domain-containing protein [Solirubrobacteraceae bacterium]
MSRLASPRLMLLVFLALLAAPASVTSVAMAASGLMLTLGAVRLGAQRWRARRAQPHDSTLLGVGRDRRPAVLSDRELSAHGLILGASGSGKTTALVTLLAQEISRGRPVIAIDMKGSPGFAAQLAAAAAAAGRQLRLWTPDGPGFWNPLQHGNATEGKDKLISTEHFSEPHYQRAAERYAQTLLQVLRHVHPARAPTLAEVVSYMDPKRLHGLLREVPEPLAERAQDYLSNLTADQLSAIRGLQTRLAVITESEAGPYLNQGQATIDLRAALDSRDVVLFSLNSSRYGKSAAQLGTLVVQDLICATGLRLQEQGAAARLRPAVIAIDEFSGIGGEHVVALFERGREAGARVLVATQEMADLDRAGRGVRDQVLGNTAFKLVFRQEVPESAHTVAQLAGTEPRWEETRQIGGTLFPGPAGRGTRREVERFVVHPNEVKTLQTGDAVLISRLRGEAARVVRVTPARAERDALER